MGSPAAPADTRFTYDDFVLLPDDGKRHEIIDGEHYVAPSPDVRHRRLVRRLLVEIELYLKANPRAGEVFSASLDVVLSHVDVVALTSEDGDVLTTPPLPGCQIDLRELFRSGR